jgi:hypothetical protein
VSKEKFFGVLGTIFAIAGAIAAIFWGCGS